MITNNEIKQVRQLQQKKYRLEQNRFVVEGEKLLDELRRSNLAIEKIYGTAAFLERTPTADAIQVSAEQMERMSGLKSPPGILATVVLPEHSPQEDWEGWVLALDGVSDPGNFGTVLRIADWFGLSHVYASRDTVEAFNPKSVQAAMGAVFRVPVTALDLSEWLSECRAKGIPVFAAEMKGERLNAVDFPAKGVLVMGSESHGLRTEVQQSIDRSVTIPGGGGAESLNVGVATGIICSRLPMRSQLPFEGE